MRNNLLVTRKMTDLPVMVRRAFSERAQNEDFNENVVRHCDKHQKGGIRRFAFSR
jgi:hypothetical protein